MKKKIFFYLFPLSKRNETYLYSPRSLGLPSVISIESGTGDVGSEEFLALTRTTTYVMRMASSAAARRMTINAHPGRPPPSDTQRTKIVRMTNQIHRSVDVLLRRDVFAERKPEKIGATQLKNVAAKTMWPTMARMAMNAPPPTTW